MMQLFDFLQQYSDYFIIGLLLLMSIIMLAMVIERYSFLKKGKRCTLFHYSRIRYRFKSQYDRNFHHWRKCTICWFARYSYRDFY